MKLNVRWRSRLLLHADLPYLGEEGLALRHLLEGLALWQGQPLNVACDVDGMAAAVDGRRRRTRAPRPPKSPGARVDRRSRDGPGVRPARPRG